jgi:hypothetical protein
MDRKLVSSKPIAQPKSGSPMMTSVRSSFEATTSGAPDATQIAKRTLLGLPPASSPIDEATLLKATLIETPPTSDGGSGASFDPRDKASKLSIEVCDSLLEDLIMTPPCFGRTTLYHTPIPKRVEDHPNLVAKRLMSAASAFRPTLDDFDLMICHPDFPYLVALAQRVRSLKAAGVMGESQQLHSTATTVPPDVMAHVDRIRERLPSKDLSIARGHYPTTDLMMQECFSILLHAMDSTKMNQPLANIRTDETPLSLDSAPLPTPFFTPPHRACRPDTATSLSTIRMRQVNILHGIQHVAADEEKMEIAEAVVSLRKRGRSSFTTMSARKRHKIASEDRPEVEKTSRRTVSWSLPSVHECGPGSAQPSASALCVRNRPKTPAVRKRARRPISALPTHAVRRSPRLMAKSSSLPGAARTAMPIHPDHRRSDSPPPQVGNSTPDFREWRPKITVHGTPSTPTLPRFAFQSPTKPLDGTFMSTPPLYSNSNEKRPPFSEFTPKICKEPISELSCRSGRSLFRPILDSVPEAPSDDDLKIEFTSSPTRPVAENGLVTTGSNSFGHDDLKRLVNSMSDAPASRKPGPLLESFNEMVHDSINGASSPSPTSVPGEENENSPTMTQSKMEEFYYPRLCNVVFL